MSVLIALLTLVLLAVVIWIVSGPLLAGGGSSADPSSVALSEGDPSAAGGVESEPVAARREDLEAARAAKYHEIRDAELDYRTGKLSREDFEAVDGALRAEALEILNRLEVLEGHDGDDAISTVP